MKYQLTALKNKNNTQISLQNIVSGQTRHVRGYGRGVTFTVKPADWKHSASYDSARLLVYAEPSIATQ